LDSGFGLKLPVKKSGFFNLKTKGHGEILAWSVHGAYMELTWSQDGRSLCPSLSLKLPTKLAGSGFSEFGVMKAGKPIKSIKNYMPADSFGHRLLDS
jgi:hypothetical protein